ncbi:hypothetical protein [Cupriavidus oxalaticus]|uniref:Uncharacterized protein n=1 Tax=Cupriavidus oxalaticus TaxID=96344 RepID=A0A5P3VK04_9BURK|nr:hypothetical protein [Cupriavidus oxalaticus]QEZ45702.1 hypothetical protein D2917_15355 [Cupriavidus oxalaticus]
MPAAESAFANLAADLTGTDCKIAQRRKPKSEVLPSRVVALLAQASAPMSAPAVARAVGVSWPTAAATLREMAEAGQVLVGQTEGGQHRYALPLPGHATTAAHAALIRKSLSTGADLRGEPDLEAVLQTLGQPD